MPKVSVILPTHNRAEFLRTAIGSVLKQTFQDLELLVVDDNSTDHTRAVVSSFHPDAVRYIRHDQTRGGAAARNTGIRCATAEFVAFLDDDDEWLPEKLATQLAVLETSPQPVGGIYSGYLIVDRASGQVINQKVADKRGDLSHALLLNNCVGGTSSVGLKKACLEEVGLFDERLPSFQDYDLWIRFAKAFHFECINQPLLIYYTHGKQIWTNLDALQRGLEMLLEKHHSSPALRTCCSYYYLFLGVQHCRNGDMRRGRKAFLKAAQFYPFEIRHYFNFCLSFLGPEKYQRVKLLRQRVATAKGFAFSGS
jgi:glycosyltransferase involved in cell wall biosynthesis